WHRREMRHHLCHERAIVNRLRLCLEYREHDGASDAFDIAAGRLAKFKLVDLFTVSDNLLPQRKLADPRNRSSTVTLRCRRLCLRLFRSCLSLCRICHALFLSRPRSDAVGLPNDNVAVRLERMDKVFDPVVIEVEPGIVDGV